MHAHTYTLTHTKGAPKESENKNVKEVKTPYAIRKYHLIKPSLKPRLFFFPWKEVKLYRDVTVTDKWLGDCWTVFLFS